MARIFLSYAREDAVRAKSLASALERASHSVWWDRYVGGGARFAAEIAEALKDAEIVIVLWSSHSINSTWVQDEAAEGRDSGKLIPLLIDGTRPPLGFRQVQGIDLSRWRGRGKPPRLLEIEKSIGRVLRGELALPAAEGPAYRRARWSLSGWRTRAAAAAAVLALGGSAFVATNRQLFAAPVKPTLAVMPFADFSPQRDKAYLAEGVAEEIRTLLSDVSGVQVTGRTSTEMLGPTADFRQAREKLGATHLLEGSMRIEGQKMRLHARLVRTDDGMQIWAEEFDSSLDDIFKVQDELGAAVARRLRGTVFGSPLQRRSIRTSAQVIDLVLAARAKWEEETDDPYKSALDAERMLKRAVQLDPDYAPAWTELSRAVFVLDQAKSEGPWGPKWPRERERALGYARKAIEVDPRHADGHAWLGYLEGSNEHPEIALARIEKAIELNPDDRRTWDLAGLIFAQTCQRSKQLEYVRRVVALEPLQLDWQVDFMFLLYALGHNREADEVRRKVSRDPRLARQVTIWTAAHRGDFSTAIANRLRRDGKLPWESKSTDLLSANLLHGLGANERAVELLPAGYKDSQGANWRGDHARAASHGAFMYTTFWHNARNFAIERSMVRAGKHRELLRIFEKRFGSVEEFDRRLHCELPAHAAPVAMALRRVGRGEEASRLIALGLKRVQQVERERDYEPETSVGHIELLLLSGRLSDAVTALEHAVRQPGARDEGPPVIRLDLTDPIYDPIRNHPRFKAVEARIAAWRAKELRELASAGITV